MVLGSEAVVLTEHFGFIVSRFLFCEDVSLNPYVEIVTRPTSLSTSGPFIIMASEICGQVNLMLLTHFPVVTLRDRWRFSGIIRATFPHGGT